MAQKLRVEKLKVGLMPYLNSAVFYKRMPDDTADLVEYVPREMALAVERGDIDAGPLPVAEYSAMLMHGCQGKCYTPAEYGAILAELDFEVGAYEDTIADRGFMTAVKI